MRRMIWIVAAVAVVIAAYCGTWWHFSEQARRTITAWIDGLPSDRVTIAPGGMRRGGFPFAVRWTFDGPRGEALWALGEVAGRADELALWIELWTPDIVRYRATALDIVTRHDPTGRAWRVITDRVLGKLLGAAPGGFEALYDIGALKVEEVDFRDPGISVRQVAEARSAEGAVRGPTGRDGGPGHDSRLALQGLHVPEIRELLGGEAGSAEIRLTLRGSIGDASIEDLVEWRDASGVLEIEQLALDWPPVDLNFDGTLTLDEQLRLLGAGTADIRGLTGLIDGLVERGTIKRSEGTVAKLALALLTRPAKDGGGAVVRLPLTAQNGVLRGGPFVLGRLPPLIR